MAKKSYTGTKLGITAAIAGVTMLTAGWLASPASQSNSTAVLADTGVLSQESIAALATATPSSATGSSAVTTTKTSTRSTTSTKKTSKGS